GLHELDPVANRLEVVELLRGRAAYDAEHLVAVLEQKLGEQGSVLSGDAGDERAAGGHGSQFYEAVVSGRWNASGLAICGAPRRALRRRFCSERRSRHGSGTRLAAPPR